MSILPAQSNVKYLFDDYLNGNEIVKKDAIIEVRKINPHYLTKEDRAVYDNFVRIISQDLVRNESSFLRRGFDWTFKYIKSFSKENLAIGLAAVGAYALGGFPVALGVATIYLYRAYKNYKASSEKFQRRFLANLQNRANLLSQLSKR
jgi:hypothetical protein